MRVTSRQQLLSNMLIIRRHFLNMPFDGQSEINLHSEGRLSSYPNALFILPSSLPESLVQQKLLTHLHHSATPQAWYATQKYRIKQNVSSSKHCSKVCVPFVYRAGFWRRVGLAVGKPSVWECWLRSDQLSLKRPCLNTTDVNFRAFQLSNDHLVSLLLCVVSLECIKMTTFSGREAGGQSGENLSTPTFDGKLGHLSVGCYERLL